MARAFHDDSAAAGALGSGGVLLLNTDTLPGFHCRVDRPAALRRLIGLKGRPDGKPLLVLAGSRQQARTLTGELDSRQEQVCRSCWPGPFSLILPARTDLAAVITAGLGTVAVRVPAADALRSLILAAGAPLVSTSVNQAGEPPCTDLLAAVAQFGEDVDGFWNDGRDPVAAGPSALVDVTTWPPSVLRPGPLDLPDFSG